jgi:hypothetical protein
MKPYALAWLAASKGRPWASHETRREGVVKVVAEVRDD